MVGCLIMFMLSRHLAKTFISSEVAFLHLFGHALEKDLCGYEEIAVHICFSYSGVWKCYSEGYVEIHNIKGVEYAGRVCLEQ
jgi:hypothetical protein